MSVFTGRLPFDDEGYVLVSLRGWMGGNALYDDVYSQYGPAFFQLIGAPFRVFGNEYVTFEAARAVTALLAAITATSLGFVAARITKSPTVGLAAGVAVALCAPAGLEAALHPTHLVLALIGLAAVAVVKLSDRPNSLLAALGLGLLVALTALVKINAGVLLGAAALTGVGVVAHQSSIRLRLLVPVAVIGVAALVAELGDYPTHFVSYLALGALVVAMSAPNVVVRGEVPRARVLVAAVIAAGIVVWLVLRNGTSVNGLAKGTLVDPLRQARAFTSAMGTGRFTLIALLLIFLLAVLVNVARRPAVTGVVFVVLGAAACVAAHEQRYGSGLVFGVNTLVAGAALGWIVLRTPEGDVPASRAMLCALGVLLPLQAYPVAGAQRAAGVLVLPVIGAVALFDGLRALKCERATPALFAVAATVASVAGLVHAYNERADAVRLPFAGEFVRTTARDVGEVRGVRSKLTQCATFYSLPGLNSFYFFAKERPPTWQNAGAWMTLFDKSRQAKVVRDLKRVDGLCVLRNRGIERSWLAGGHEIRGPLRPYLDSFTTPVATVGDYEIYRSAG